MNYRLPTPLEVRRQIEKVGDTIHPTENKTAPCNVYKPLTLQDIHMRIGKYELAILELLYTESKHWREIKQTLSGYSKLDWDRLGVNKWYHINSIHKSLVRSVKTLLEKELITNTGDKRYTILELTEKGKIAYIKRAEIAESE